MDKDAIRRMKDAYYEARARVEAIEAKFEVMPGFIHVRLVVPTPEWVAAMKELRAAAVPYDAWLDSDVTDASARTN